MPCLGARSDDERCWVRDKVSYPRLAETALFRAGIQRVDRDALDSLQGLRNLGPTLRDAYDDFRALATAILRRIDLPAAVAAA